MREAFHESNVNAKYARLIYIRLQSHLLEHERQDPQHLNYCINVLFENNSVSTIILKFFNQMLLAYKVRYTWVLYQKYNKNHVSLSVTSTLFFGELIWVLIKVDCKSIGWNLVLQYTYNMTILNVLLYSRYHK